MTVIAVLPGIGRPRLTLVGGNLAPRLLSSDANGARVALVATTALLLGGDSVELDVTVGSGTWLEIVETAGTVAYDARGQQSTWTVRAHIEDGALLLWHGEPFVVASGANALRCSTFAFGDQAMACLRETIVLGRTGESGGAVRIHNSVTRSETPILVEDLDLRSTTIRRLPGILGTARVVDTVTVLGTPVPPEPTVGNGSRFELDAGAGTVGRVLRAGLAGSPAASWWRAWSEAARRAYLMRK